MKPKTSNQPKLLVDTRDLADILSIGQSNARLVGEQAGAIVRIGNRRLYNVEIIKNYINSQQEIKINN
jgi:hypothetical protein